MLKISGLLISVAMLCPYAAEGASTGGVASCQSIQDDLTRLACYDNLFVESVPEDPAPLGPAPLDAGDPAPLAEPQDANLDDEFGKEQVEPTPVEEVESRLVGEFNGWTGKTVFTLANGQVWRQVHNRMKNYKPREPIYQPKVIISKSFFGSYKLRVEGVSRIIQVKRVK